MNTSFLTDDQWQHILRILRRETRVYVGADDSCRRFVEAVLWMTRSGAPWRLLPREYGAWNSVYKRYARWCETGVWERVFAVVSEAADLENLSVDSTTVKAHACATGATKKAEALRHKGLVGDGRA